jgi:hypothetical protein
VILDDAYQGESIVFIVGCPRSGTTWLQRMLAAHPSIITGQESHLFDYYIGGQLRIWEHARRHAATARGGIGMGCYVDADEYVQLVRGYMLSLLRPMLAPLQPGQLFLEKTPDHALFLPEILRLLPRARIIHLVRDPRGVAASLLSAARGWGAPWAPGSAARAALMWSRYVQAVREAVPLLPAGQFLELRFEDLHAATGAELQRVSGFLGCNWEAADLQAAVEANSLERARRGAATGIPVRGAFATASGAVVEPEGFVRKGQPDAWRQDLNGRQKTVVQTIAAAQMAELGYAPPPGRTSRLLNGVLRRTANGALARYLARRKP